MFVSMLCLGHQFQKPCIFCTVIGTPFTKGFDFCVFFLEYNEVYSKLEVLTFLNFMNFSIFIARATRLEEETWDKIRKHFQDLFFAKLYSLCTCFCKHFWGCKLDRGGKAWTRKGSNLASPLIFNFFFAGFWRKVSGPETFAARVMQHWQLSSMVHGNMVRGEGKQLSGAGVKIQFVARRIWKHFLYSQVEKPPFSSAPGGFCEYNYIHPFM